MSQEPSAVTVPTQSGPMPAWLWLPPAGSGPGVVLLQEIFGVSPYVRRRAAALASEGYLVLAPDLYWRSDDPPLDESAPDVVEVAMGRARSLDWETTVDDAVATLAHLRGLDETGGRAGVLGFCFGGGLGFHLAAVADPDVLVAYYGSAIPGLLHLAPQVTAPSLHHFGLSDDFIDAATVAAVRDALTSTPAGARFETYEGANHAFDNDDFFYHHPRASALAWERTVEFLADHLT
ncbi:MAG: dienelactone hydrolase family protein [Nocardioides sp.]